MSTTDTRTIAELNAATDAQRTAQTRAQVNSAPAGKRTASTGNAPKRAGSNAPASKRTASKSATATAGKRAARSTAPRSTTQAGPTKRAVNLAIAQHCTDLLAQWFGTLPTRTTKRDGKQVNIASVLGTKDAAWYSWTDARQMVKQVVGYVPQQVTYPKSFGARDVGRPAA